MRIAELRKQLSEKVINALAEVEIADREQRVKAQNERRKLLYRIAEERAKAVAVVRALKDPKDPKLATERLHGALLSRVPGGDTGFVVATLRKLGNNTITEYQIDTALLCAIAEKC